MTGPIGTTGEGVIVYRPAAPLEPGKQTRPGVGGDLELYWALGFVLHDDGVQGHLITMRHISHPQGDKIAATQLAVDAQVEQGESRTRPSF